MMKGIESFKIRLNSKNQIVRLIIVIEEQWKFALVPEYHEEDNSQDCSENQCQDDFFLASLVLKEEKTFQ
jgi:hypothetical protein